LSFDWRVPFFVRVWWVDVLQTLQNMFSTCTAMFVARSAGSYDTSLQFLALWNFPILWERL
jgi:hypothetical protein